MPNIIAYLALLSWPLVCVALFKKRTPGEAIVWSILGGYLILPPLANFNLPILPSLDKGTIPSLCALVGCMIWAKSRDRVLPTSWVGLLLVLIFVGSAIPTVMSNTDPAVFTVLPNSEPIVFKSWELPALRFRDVFSVVGNQLIVLIPFLLARRYLAGEAQLRALVFAFAIAGLIYTLPALIEIRLSPQINTWVYGFHQHDFGQSVRAGGFRPLVFLEHGLWLAFFMLSCLLAAAALFRHETAKMRLRMFCAMLYLALILYLCKSLASLAYGVALAPLVVLASARMQLRVAVLFALIAAVYPLLRGGGIIPAEDVLAVASMVDPERSASLAYRFANEQDLLGRAAERPWLGWGGWGRNLVYDADTGALLTIPDGRWIITLGTYGFVGYIAEFGLLAAPLFLLAWEAWRGAPNVLSRPAAVIALVVGINMIDLLVNATLTPLTWLMAGATLGCAERLRSMRMRGTGNQGLRGTPVLGGALQDRSKTIL